MRSMVQWGSLVSALVLAAAPMSKAASLKAVQSGTVVLPGAGTSVTDTLSPAVDTSKAFLVFGISGNDNSPDDMHVSGQITNGTTVTFERFGTTGNIVVHWYVAEFLSGVTVQRGTTQMPGVGNPADTNVPIALVDTTKSFPLISFRTNGSNFDGGDFVRAKITSGTNLLLAAPDADTSSFVEWQVVEYADASVQTGDLFFGSGDASLPDILAAPVDTSKSWLIYTFDEISGWPNIGRALIRGVVTDPNTVTFDRNNTGDGFDLTWYLVEFTDATTVQHASEPFTTTELQRDVTLASPVNPGTSLASGGYFGRGGRSDYALDDDPGVGWFTFDLTSSTTLRIDRGTTIGNTATGDAGWFVVDFVANGCAPLDVSETSSTITVTASGDFEMTFDTTAGGSIERMYDLSEDPTKQNDLVGALPGSGSSKGLHNSGMRVGADFFNAGESLNGRLELLEATSTRVRVRQVTPFDEGGVVGELTGVRGTGDYSVYPSGKIGLRWERTTTAPVTYVREYFETFTHYTSSGPLSTWAVSSETSTTSPGGGGDDFVLSENENAGPEPARTDFLHVLHKDWTMGNGYAEASDFTQWAFQASSERVNPGWIEDTGRVVPVDEVQTWDLLTYTRPRTLSGNGSAPVLDRSADYRGPDALSVSVGGPWNAGNQNTASDDFNEAEAAYLLTFDMGNGLTFDIDGGTTPRFAPFFKIREWQSVQSPTVTLEGTALTEGTDFQADVKPVSRAHFAQDVLLHNTLQSTGAVDTNPDIGSAGAVAGTTTFVAGRYGNGARFDAINEVITFPSAGNINLVSGAIELWYRPDYDHDDGARHRIWTYRFDDDHQIFLRKHDTNQLQMQIRTGPTPATDWVVTNVTSANYSWKAGDWVHLRASWDDSAPIGDEARIFVNGVEPTHSNSPNDYDSSLMTAGGTISIGTDSNGNSPALGVIDELRIYSTATEPDPLAHGGLTSSADEFLASGAQNFTLDLNAVDGSGRGERVYFGSDSTFRGLNVLLATRGVGNAVLQFEFWNGTQWSNLAVSDGTNGLTNSGTISWTDSALWSEYSIDGGPDLFYVRASVASGSYTTTPVEAFIKTDILLFQYCGEINLNNQTFDFAVPLPTAVELVSFEAESAGGAVELRWETASELQNLGFHLYRSTSEEGPYRRITAAPIPGLGSSPMGALYRHLDADVTDGVTYYYELEDIETTGRTERHGPVSATPDGGTPPEGGGGRITYGDPDASSFIVRTVGRNDLWIELRTEGFHADTAEDGSVQIRIPGLQELLDEGISVPVKRVWLDALAGRKTRITSVRASDIVTFETLRPSEGSELELIANESGTVRTQTRLGRRAFRGKGLFPEEIARISAEAFQGAEKKALIELAPIRWNGEDGTLALAKRLVVRISRSERVPNEIAGRGRARRGRVVNRLVTRERGLYAVKLDAGAPVELRLSRLGEDVPYLVRDGVLYFWSGGSDENPYGHEAVFELALGAAGRTMEVETVRPGDTALQWYWHTEHAEKNRLYQAGLVDAEDPWLWDLVMATESKDFELIVTDVGAAHDAQLLVQLQGASDVPDLEDHHARLYVNGTFVGEGRWDGKKPYALGVEVPAGTLVDGVNTLAVENVGDTGAAWSMMMLDRFELRYPRFASARSGSLEGEWEGPARVEGAFAAARVLDVTDVPRWLDGLEVDGHGVLRFDTDPGRRYAVVNVPLRPEIRRARAPRLLNRRNRAEYLVIGPRAFLSAAKPLLRHRREQGLRARSVALEDVYDVFGHGETRPEAIRDFLEYAYHEWSGPSLRYVVLLGDGTFDYKDYLGTGVANHVPPLMTKTSYLWTASDPAYAAVHGDDNLPDVAIGRLPATSREEVTTLVQKILAYEANASAQAPVVLVNDDADRAGNFPGDAQELSRTVLAPFRQSRIDLGELGTAATRSRVVASLDEGTSLLSYIGHGGINLWADENVFNTSDIPALGPQPEQPILLTMNCLNGYFHFPYFDSLAEAMVKAEGKGAIAAFSPSGLSLNAAAKQYHRAVLTELLGKRHERLGGCAPRSSETLSRGRNASGAARHLPPVRRSGAGVEVAQPSIGCIVRPPTTVRTTSISLMRSGSTSCGSSAKMTKSASFPAVMEPLLCSSKEARAPLIVPILRASSTVIFWFSPQTRPRMSLRVTML